MTSWARGSARKCPRAVRNLKGRPGQEKPGNGGSLDAVTGAATRPY
jgi:hypothetical protein